MPYPILTYDTNTTITTIVDGSLDTTSTTLKLPGPNYVGYGGILNENLVYLLENFAGNTAPTNPGLQGQLWFDKVNQTIKVYTNQGYFNVGGTTAVSATTPALIRTGDTWFNTTTNQLFVYDGSAYQLAGPGYTQAQGVSGAIPVQVTDGVNTHNILELKYGTNTTQIYAIVSSDDAFTPSPGITGFTQIKPGINFNSNISATINSDIVGNLTGNVAGSLVGVAVVATNLYGNLTGNIVGSLIGDAVVATNLYGNLTGDVTSSYIATTNFSSSNAVITGGSITGDSSGTFTTLQGTNFSSGNAVITGGSITGDSSGTFITLQGTNFSSGNAQITGGRATGLDTVSATSATLTNSTAATTVTTNLSTANAQITGGNITGITNTSATTARFSNVSTGNARISGGQISYMNFIAADAGTFNNFSSSNVLVTGGNVSGITGYNNGFANASLINSTATTKSRADNSTAIATTAFVQSVLPTGVIVMWGGSVGSIPAGWHLCDGSNGTPDLTNQFIMGAGNVYSPNTTGGVSTVTLANVNIPGHSHSVTAAGNTGAAGSHVHTVSVSDPGHQHRVSGYALEGYNGTNYVPWYNWGNPGNPASNNPNTTKVTTGITASLSTATDHFHSVDLSGATGMFGGGQPFTIIPPYYALCYIQKLF